MNALCQCGCGLPVLSEKARYISGHNLIALRKTPQWLAMVRRTHTGKKLTQQQIEELRKRNKTMVGPKHWAWGKHFSEEHRHKLSLANKGKHVPNAMTLAKMQASHLGQPAYWKGKHLPADVRAKISIAHKGQLGWFKGKHFSPEHRAKLRIAHLGHPAWNKGKRASPAAIIKMKEAAIRYAEERQKGYIIPCVGREEARFFDAVEKRFGVTILRQEKLHGCFVDGWFPVARIALEYDEPYHKSAKRTAKDERRDFALASRGIQTVRVRQEDWLAQPTSTVENLAPIAVTETALSGPCFA